MRKYLFFIAIVLCSVTHSYAQENINMIDILNIKKDVRHLEKRISKLVRKNPDIAKMKGLKQFHIFCLCIDDATKLQKEDYINLSFLYNLRTYQRVLYTLRKNPFSGNRSSIRRESDIIASNTFLIYSNGFLVADDTSGSLSPTYSSYNTFLAKVFFDKEIDFAFRILTPSEMQSVDIGIKENSLYVFGIDDDGYEIIYTWDEFIDCCLDDWINGRRTKKWTD